MQTAGDFEAPTHLAALLDRVAVGERIEIMRHGVPAAVPVSGMDVKLSHFEVSRQRSIEAGKGEAHCRSPGPEYGCVPRVNFLRNDHS